MFVQLNKQDYLYFYIFYQCERTLILYILLIVRKYIKDLDFFCNG